ncbi:cytochrome ubiquinol oxidase subunit I [Paracoccus sp. S-4012]|nr:cytochrome ubiquinol oxidase subunit I [Paracoccus sp. S-4012]
MAPIARHKALHAIWNPGRGLYGFTTTINHSVLGVRFMVTAGIFFAIGGILSMLIRAQLATPDSGFLTADTYNQIFTMHGTVMMFLFAIPMLEGFGLYILPKMLGTRDIAFPRLGAYGYWCYLFGGSILVVSMLFGAAPDAGWFMYTPLSSDVYTPGISADVWLLGVTFVEISGLTMAVELVVSILLMRAPGMSLGRMPILAWYYLVTSAMMVVGFPPLIAGSLMLEAERAFGFAFFDPLRGGSPLLWQHLFWLFGHPEVYIIFLPGAGILSTMIPTLCGVPLRGYRIVVAAIVGMGIISFLIWAHHMFTVGLPLMGLHFFSVSSVLVAVPTAVQIFAWLATMAKGRTRRTMPMLYVFGFVVIFVNGGLTGVMVAIAPFNWQVHDTHFITAHMHYVLIGGFLFPLLGALYYWMPHVTGRLNLQSVGIPAFWLIFAGFNGTFLLMHLTGLLGMRRRVHGYEWADGWHWLNLLSSVSGFVLAMGLALVLADIILHRKLGQQFRRNPWEAQTLEWAIPTPPASYAFAAIPAINSRADKLDPDRLGRELAGGEGYLAIPRGWQETMVVDMRTGRPDHIVILPRNTVLPLLTGLATAAAILGMLFKVYAAAIGFAGLVVVLFLISAARSGQKEDHGLIDAGQGLKLPVHTEVARPLPVRATQITLFADGALFASLLFGVAYLRFASPGWPPPEAARMRGETGEMLILLAAGAVVTLATCVLRRWWVARNAEGGGWGVVPWLTGAVELAAGAALVLLLWSGWLPDPRAHALGATMGALVAYAILHVGVGFLMTVATLIRRMLGRVGMRRRYELELARIWTDYTAATTAVALGVAAALVLTL